MSCWREDAELRGDGGDPTWVGVRAQGWKAHLCRRAGCKGAPGKGPRWCSLPGRGECGCAKQGGWGLCRCESKGTTGTTGPSRLQGEEGEASPVESALGSRPPRKQGWGGRGLWTCFPKRRPCVRGMGSLGLGPMESGLPARLVTGSTVDPPAPVPKKSQVLNPPPPDSVLPSDGSPTDRPGPKHS